MALIRLDDKHFLITDGMPDYSLSLAYLALLNVVLGKREGGRGGRAQKPG